jgi:1-acyl-sn-glycerol-3-phosphate acyltransferase
LIWIRIGSALVINRSDNPYKVVITSITNYIRVLARNIQTGMKALKVIYSIYVIIIFIVILLILFPAVLFIQLFPIQKRNVYMHHLLVLYSFLWMTLIGMRSKFYNENILHESGSCIITPNHSSYLDAVFIYRSIDVVFLTLGKIEIAKAPLFGMIYKSVVVLVDRSSAVKRAKSFLEMTSVLERGIDIVIFPEGTFDEFDSDLKPFHDGAFRLALHAHKPILPILYVDARERLHPSSLFSFSLGKNRIVYLPPVQVSNIAKGNEKELKEYVYQYMNTSLNYCRENDCKNSLQFAQQWLASNPFIPKEIVAKS